MTVRPGVVREAGRVLHSPRQTPWHLGHRDVCSGGRDGAALASVVLRIGES